MIGQTVYEIIFRIAASSISGQKEHGVSRHGIKTLWPLILFTLSCVPAVLAQSPSAQTTQLLKSDATSTLALAEKRNNLEQDGGQPWHIRATYETFDMEGKPNGKGTYEEWWVSTKRNKHTFATSGFSRTDYFTDEGGFRTEKGKMSTLIGPERIKALVRPLSEEKFDAFTSEVEERKLGNVLLKCITLTWRKGAPVVPIAHMYCFDPDQLILRAAISEYGFYQTLYEGQVRFGDRYLAKEIRVLADQRPVANIHVEQSEVLSAIKDAEFARPVDAKDLPPGVPRFGVVTGSLKQHLVRGVQPENAEAARAGHVQGEVTIKVTIDEDGKVTNPQVVSGPSILRQAAVDAVSQWHYKPFVANHEPTAIQTTFVLDCSRIKKEKTITCWQRGEPSSYLPF
jgi:TonB family protein